MCFSIVTGRLWKIRKNNNVWEGSFLVALISVLAANGSIGSFFMEIHHHTHASLMRKKYIISPSPPSSHNEIFGSRLSEVLLPLLVSIPNWTFSSIFSSLISKIVYFYTKQRKTREWIRKIGLRRTSQESLPILKIMIQKFYFELSKSTSQKPKK